MNRCPMFLSMVTIAILAAAPAGAADSRLQVQDRDGDGSISRDEFVGGLPEGAGEDAKVKVMKLFEQMDKNRDGILAMDEIPQRPKPPEDTTARAPAATDEEPDTEPTWPVVEESNGSCDYAIVISKSLLEQPAWKAVADALFQRHQGRLVAYEGSVVNALPELARLHPRYTAFVARPEVVGRIFVARIHRLTRRLDNDPYADTIWGIVSAATPEAALRMATATEPACVRSVISNTGVDNSLYDSVFTLSDGTKGDWFWKKADGTATEGNDGDADRTKLFVEKFQELHPDAIVTSGHATEGNLEMPFSRGNTIAKDGFWIGMANWKEPLKIEPDGHPRIFIGAGNCLIGNFQKRPTSMAATLTGAYGVNQFVGYTVPTWFGRGGWGTLKLWQQPGGGYSLAEAWFFTNQALLQELQISHPKTAIIDLPISEKGEGIDFGDLPRTSNKDEAGLLWDRDVVAFYGDPAFRVLAGARPAPANEVQFKQDGGKFRLTITPPKDRKLEAPAAFLLPARIAGKLEIVAGDEFQPLVTDDFILFAAPNPEPGKPTTVEFRQIP